jgi:glycosyltransferase involved in cell wall biosynthesis
MQRLLDHPDYATKLGQAAKKRHEETISWGAVISTVTGLPADPIFGTRGLPKIVIAMTFAFFPPRHGGQARVYNLYSYLARHFDVAIVCLVPSSSKATDREVAPGLREICIPQSSEHARQESQWQRELGVPVADISAMMLHEKTPGFAAALARECAGAAAVVCCHPFFGPLLMKLFDGPLWYEAQDVEVDIKTAILPLDSLLAKRLVKATHEAEAAVCRHAQWVWTCSTADADRLMALYGLPPERMVVVPNGTDVAAYRYRIGEERASFRKRLLGADKTPLALFMGSGHQPNIDALKVIMQCAHQLPETRFVVMGSVCYAIDPKMKPENVWFLGEVSETERHIVLELADFALNPIASGSGTNLKMLDYFAAGLPVLTSPVGARGLAVVEGEHCLIRDLQPLDNFIKALRRLGREPTLCTNLAIAARQHVEQHFDWERIANGLVARLTG